MLMHGGSRTARVHYLAGTFRLLIPLLTFALTSRAASRDGLTEGAFPLARFGLPRFVAMRRSAHVACLRPTARRRQSKSCRSVAPPATLIHDLGASEFFHVAPRGGRKEHASRRA